MSLSGCHHVAVVCSDYERSKQFYLSLPGAELVAEVFREQRQSYKLNVRFGTSELEIFSFPKPPLRPSYPEACGLRHLAFRVADLGKTVEKLHQLEIATEEIRIDQATGKQFTFFSDPDGLPLEIYED